MAVKEYSLKVEDYEQLMGALASFDTTLTESCCKLTISKTETTMFNKWVCGKSDLFTSSLHLDGGGQDGVPDKMELFIPDVKKFIVVLKNIGKYYDVKDAETFNGGSVRLSVSESKSYVKISSKKYTIKFQLSTSAVVESRNSKIETTVDSSKYGGVMHNAVNKEDVQSNFLLMANIPSSKFAEINEMLSTLAEGAEASIKIQIPEEVAIEEELNSECIPNTMYATISDSGKLVKSNIGNKVSIEFGKITYAASNYKDVCGCSSMFDNFVFLMSKQVLDVLSSICRTFSTASKTRDVEIVISKPNLMHLNMSTESQNAKSEIYVTVIGSKAASML